MVDVQLRRLQVFDSAGALERTVPLNDLGRVNAFEILSRNRYVFTAIHPTSEDVVYLTDTNAVVMASYLSIRSILPELAEDDPIWETVRAFLMSLRGDTAYVVSTLSDTLWSVRVPDGTITRTRLEIPGYIRPFIPTADIR